MGDTKGQNAKVEGDSVQKGSQQTQTQTQTVATGVIPGKCPTCGRDKVNS